jgi:hypothetical protein
MAALKPGMAVNMLSGHGMTGRRRTEMASTEYSPKQRVQTLITEMSKEVGARLSDTPPAREEPKVEEKAPARRGTPRHAAATG